MLIFRSSGSLSRHNIDIPVHVTNPEMVLTLQGWALKSKTAFGRNSPVFLLGKCYHFKAVGKMICTQLLNRFAKKFYLVFKGLLDPKMKMLSLFTYPHVVPTP